MVFKVENPDYNLSPYTGMTRKHWLDAGRYLLEGIFSNLGGIEDPIVMPRKETKVTYPHLDAPKEQQEAERKAEIFEGLTRSFFIASVMIRNEPDIEICGIRLKDYYKKHILRACTKEDKVYVGSYEDMQSLTGGTDPFRTFQQTVETSALVIGLQACREQIWMSYTQEEKDRIASLLSGFAHGNTVPQNWRFFNMLDLAFLYKEGYEIDKEIMVDHAQALLNYTVGDGWYRDGQCFDYYSCWAFNIYAPIWNSWYGYENEPYLAKRFEECSNQLAGNYPDFFDRDGFTNMWGRSCIYRNGATGPLSANFFLQNPMADPGRARRIASGSLLQFLKRDDFLHKGVPTLGFYDQFTPLVQGYSCAESPLWLGKAFLCLELPPEHPFWTAQENNGTWEQLKKGEVRETTLPGPALSYTNHEANGETILRSGKIYKEAKDVHGIWNYGKLNYNTKYPWESTPVARWILGQREATKEESLEEKQETRQEICESQQYLLFEQESVCPSRGNITIWCGEKEGVLYRRQFFDGSLALEQHWIQAVNLADFPVERGIMRVDKLRLIRRPVTMTLGSYGFPDNPGPDGKGTKILMREETLPDGSRAQAIILTGHDHMGVPRQMAMTCYQGWEKMELIYSTGTNPDSENSIVICASMKSRKQYGSAEPYLLISQVITAELPKQTEEKENGECAFTEEELFPIREILYEDTPRTGAYGTTTICLKNGQVRKVNFEGIEAAF